MGLSGVEANSRNLYWECFVKVIRPRVFSMVHGGVRHFWIPDTPKNDYIEVVWIVCPQCHRTGGDIWYANYGRGCKFCWWAEYPKEIQGC